MAIIGRRNTLSIERAAGPGLYLNGGELGEILLPGRYIPPDLAPGVKLDVFSQLAFDEDRSPQAIRENFGCSKKAFKQALGALYKSRRIRFQPSGIQMLDITTFAPGDR